MNSKNLTGLRAERLLRTEPTGVNNNQVNSTLDEICSIVGLIKKGNSSSLAEARKALGMQVNELATHMGISENTLNSWESGINIPRKSLLSWRIKLGDMVGAKISVYLRTSNSELTHQFFEIIWRLCS